MIDADLHITHRTFDTVNEFFDRFDNPSNVRVLVKDVANHNNIVTLDFDSLVEITFSEVDFKIKRLTVCNYDQRPKTFNANEILSIEYRFNPKNIEYRNAVKFVSYVVESEKNETKSRNRLKDLVSLKKITKFLKSRLDYFEILRITYPNYDHSMQTRLYSGIASAIRWVVNLLALVVFPIYAVYSTIFTLRENLRVLMIDDYRSIVLETSKDIRILVGSIVIVSIVGVLLSLLLNMLLKISDLATKDPDEL